MVPFDTHLLQDRHNIEFESSENREGFGKACFASEADFVQLLDSFGETIQSPDRKVTGSLFIKRYSSLIAGALYVWTHHQYALDLLLNKLRVSIAGSGLKFHILDSGEFGIPLSASCSEQKTELYLRHLFSENVGPVFDRIVQHTGIIEPNLWATLSYLLAYWKQEWLRSASSNEMILRIDEVYRIMMESGKPDWFPGNSSNPLICDFCHIEDPIHANRHILLRSKCCMNYRLPGEDRYCYTCPLISDKHRIEKYMTAHATENIMIN